MSLIPRVCFDLSFSNSSMISVDHFKTVLNSEHPFRSLFSLLVRTSLEKVSSSDVYNVCTCIWVDSASLSFNFSYPPFFIVLCQEVCCQCFHYGHGPFRLFTRVVTKVTETAGEVGLCIDISGGFYHTYYIWFTYFHWRSGLLGHFVICKGLQSNLTFDLVRIVS